MAPIFDYLTGCKNNIPTLSGKREGSYRSQTCISYPCSITVMHVG